MKRFIAQILSNILAIFLATELISGITYDKNWQTLVAAGIVLGAVNFLVKPFISLFSLPLLILSLGLFSIVINAIMLYLTAYLVEGFDIKNFLSALLASILISIINVFVSSVFRKK